MIGHLRAGKLSTPQLTIQCTSATSAIGHSAATPSRFRNANIPLEVGASAIVETTACSWRKGCTWSRGEGVVNGFGKTFYFRNMTALIDIIGTIGFIRFSLCCNPLLKTLKGKSVALDDDWLYEA